MNNAANALFLFVIKAFFLEKVHLEPAMIHGSCKEATRELLLLPLRSGTSTDRCMTRSCHLWTLLLLGASGDVPCFIGELELCG